MPGSAGGRVTAPAPRTSGRGARRGGPGAGRRRSPRPRSPPDPPGPTGRNRSACSSVTRRASWCRRPVPGAARSQTTRPVRSSSSTARRSSRTGAPPMPMLPSASSTVFQRPSPGSGSKTLRRRAETPRRRAWSTASRTMSTPSTTCPRSARCALIRPGPQPTSRVAPRQCASSSRSAWLTWRTQSCTGSGSSTGSAAHAARDTAERVAVDLAERVLGRLLGTGWRGHRETPRNACANWLSGAASATDLASATSSTSRSVVDLAEPGSGTQQGFPRQVTGARGRHRHPGQVPDQVRATDSEEPPATVERRPDDRGVRGR